MANSPNSHLKRIWITSIKSALWTDRYSPDQLAEMYIIDIIIWRLKLKRHQYLGADAAHFKAFSLRYLKTESCSECLRVPFKTNPAPVNHSAFQPIPKLPFLKAAFPAVLLYCTMACFEAFLLPRLLPQIKRAK